MPGAAGQRGSASILVAGVLGVVVVLVGVALLVAGYAMAQHRVRAAADLAAVSGAAAFAGGRDACAQARRTAGANGASLLTCSTVGDPVEYVVSVRVALGVGTRVPGLPTRVVSEAHAGSAP
ncbi:helicase/secretion neighborhood TadE-like protein [Friedmanniella luteola]|uniref:Helicase/secretion neighborhood TadE-like protein n=1 Tax=Friedmanniella luteola TaxID=546871 RepID=A0A1H1LGN5_9ACTN|nr:helicase/secretion neighborhood TadE-like protein [Friedmanniella luteola]